jgi:hypothetical protein
MKQNRIIHRIHKNKEFGIIPNSLARDTSLSLAARGLLVAILSHSDDWGINRRLIESMTVLDKKHKIDSGLRELEAAGYARYVQERDVLGRMKTVIHFYDQAVPEEERTAITSRKNHRPPVLPGSVKTDNGKSGGSNKTKAIENQ